ncbi:MAG: Ig-like domain repeat protein [Oscillospiraceae bacterium]|nr:Ig-like domain repeat protein [Oscillospiraceae bacterium]
MKKRLLSMLLCLCMVIGLLPTTALAADVQISTGEQFREYIQGTSTQQAVIAADFTISDGVSEVHYSTNKAVDLKGHTITIKTMMSLSPVYGSSGLTFTLSDSVGTGQILSKNNFLSLPYPGTVNITGGYLSQSVYADQADNRQFIITGGTVSVSSRPGTLFVDGGSVFITSDFPQPSLTNTKGESVKNIKVQIMQHDGTVMKNTNSCASLDIYDSSSNHSVYNLNHAYITSGGILSVWCTGSPAKISATIGNETYTGTVVGDACILYPKFVITLDQQGGSGGTDTFSQTYGAGIASSYTAPTRSGYSFNGYYDAITDGTQYFDSKMAPTQSTWDKAKDTTLYARWTLNVPTISSTTGYSGTYNGTIPPISVTATAAVGTLSYQWYKDSISDENAIKDATSFSYSISDIRDKGTYYCRVTLTSTDGQTTSHTDSEPIIVADATPTVTAKLSSASITYEEDATLTVTVTGVKTPSGYEPAGSVSLKEGNTAIGTAQIITADNNQAKFNLTKPTAGTHTYTATYTDTSGNYVSNTVSTTLTVQKKPVTFAVTNDTQIWDNTVKKISFTPSSLTGTDYTVTYYKVDEDTNTVDFSAEVTNPRTYGRYVYVIDFANTQTNYEIKNKVTISYTANQPIPTGGNVGEMMLRVQTTPEQADTAVTLTQPTGITYGANSTLTATVDKTASDAVTGSVTFMDGDVVIGSAVVKSGVATYTWVKPAGGTHTITANYSGDLHYKPATSTASVELAVNPAAQTVSASNVTKTYGDGDFQLFAATNGDGAITYAVKDTTDVLTVTDDGVVTVLQAGEATVTATAAATGNYNTAAKDITVTVNPARLSVWATGATKFDWDGNPHPITAASYPSTALDFAYYKIADGKIEGADMENPTDAGLYFYVITPADTRNYIIPDAAVVTPGSAVPDGKSNAGVMEIFKPSKTEVEVTADPITYGENATITAKVTKVEGSGTGAGVISGTVTFSSGSTFLGIGTVKADGTASVTWQHPNANSAGYTITAAYSGDTNYTANTADGTLTVDKADQIVTAAKQITKTLGDNDFQLSATTKGDGAITFTSDASGVLTIDGDMAHMNKVGTATVTATAAETENYNEGSTTFDVTVNAAGLLLIVSDTTRNTTDPTHGITVQTYPANIEVSVAYYAIAEDIVGDEVADPADEGTYLYVITCDDNDYTIANAYTYAKNDPVPTGKPNAGVYTVSKSAQPEFKFIEPVISKTYEDDSFIIAPTGGAADNTVTYVSSDEEVAEISPETDEIIIHKAGTATITATSEADGYIPATASYALVVAKKPVTLTLSDTTVTYDGTVRNIGIDDDNDAFTPSFGADGNITATYVKNDVISVLSAQGAGKYLVTARIADSDPCYTSATATGYLQIDKAPLTVTANPKTIVYGDAPDNDGVIYTTLLGADAGHPEVLSGTLSFAYDYAQYGDIGDSYVITPSGLTSDNYDITFETGTLEVDAKPVSLTWSMPDSFVYNAAEQGVTATVSNAVNEDIVTVTDYTNNSKKDKGDYTAAATVLSNANYTLTGGTALTKDWHITAAAPTLSLAKQLSTNTGKPIAIGAAKIVGVGTDGDLSAQYTVTYTYYTDAACTKLTTTAEHGAEQEGGAPAKNGSYYVKAHIDAVGNYNAADATAELAIYTPSQGGGGGGGGAASSTTEVTLPKTDGGNVTINPTKPAKGDKVTVTVTPDEGYTSGSLTITDENGKNISYTDNEDGTYTFTMPSGEVTISSAFVKAGSNEGIFTDVAEDAYYYDAVLWAADKGVTNGTSATTFAPNVTCTRAQAVTFLWRAMGSPEPTATNCPFTDMDADAYYYKAVLWAMEKGITEGTSDTSFTPDALVTRSQTVTFLWRTAGAPAAAMDNPFTDVDDTAYYYNAVLWAAEQNITGGTSATTFSSANPCSRGQIVTFLWRQLGK